MASANPPQETSLPTPTLASHLLAAHRARTDKLAACGRDALLSTRCAEIDDEVLRGGWRRGQIVGLSGEMAVGRLMALKLVADALVKSRERVAVVDTTGSFPVRALAGVLRRVLAGTAAERRRGCEDVDVDADVRRCLGRVDICRALDFLGVVEIVGDVGSMCEDAEATRDKEAAAAAAGDAREEMGDCGEDLEASAQVTGQQGGGSKAEETGASIIVIDSITSVVENLFSSSELTSSYNLLQAFTTNLLSITRRHNILTLILNSTLSTPPPNQQALQASVYASHGSQTISPSIFASNGHLRPSLGALFSSIPELHLMLSRLPTDRPDAELLYGSGEAARDVAGVHYSYVLEVIKDEQGVLVTESGGARWESREQRWGAFDVEDWMDFQDAVVKSGDTAHMGQ